MQFANERKSCTSLSFYAYVPPLYIVSILFTRVKFTRQLKSTQSPLWSGETEMRLDQGRVAHFQQKMSMTAGLVGRLITAVCSLQHVKFVRASRSTTI